MLSLICAWTNCWANNRDTGDLRRHCAHNGVTLMINSPQSQKLAKDTRSLARESKFWPKSGSENYWYSIYNLDHWTDCTNVKYWRRNIGWNTFNKHHGHQGLYLISFLHDNCPIEYYVTGIQIKIWRIHILLPYWNKYYRLKFKHELKNSFAELQDFSTISESQ